MSEIDIETIADYSFPKENLLVKYKFTDEENYEFEIEAALSVLLVEEVIFLNNHYWHSIDRDKGPVYNTKPENPWPEEACKTVSLNVNCNDVFAWGCADAEECYYNDLEDVFDHWKKDPIWGSSIWCIKKRNEMPQKPVYDDIMKSGIWNLDEMGLEPNRYDSYLEKK